MTYRHGDFVELAESISLADLVTLDRVINVCPDWRRLAELSPSLLGICTVSSTRGTDVW